MHGDHDDEQERHAGPAGSPTSSQTLDLRSALFQFELPRLSLKSHFHLPRFELETFVLTCKVMLFGFFRQGGS
ncbi:MAG: hypothetical protein CMJ18_25890 [Phycisphaeraceae bacterium]|nr:hypothetical protein [Phycisphaeraceae bacterium]